MTDDSKTQTPEPPTPETSEDLDQLQAQWLAWVKKGSPQPASDKSPADEPAQIASARSPSSKSVRKEVRYFVGISGPFVSKKMLAHPMDKVRISGFLAGAS